MIVPELSRSNMLNTRSMTASDRVAVLDDGADEDVSESAEDKVVVVVEEEDDDTEDDSEVVVVHGDDDDSDDDDGKECIGVIVVMSLLLVLLLFLLCWDITGKARTCSVFNNARGETPTTTSICSIFFPTTLVIAAVLLRLPTSTTTEASIMSDLLNLLVVSKNIIASKVGTHFYDIVFFLFVSSVSSSSPKIARMEGLKVERKARCSMLCYPSSLGESI